MGKDIDLKAAIEKRSNEINDDIISFRRHIHQNPELSFEEKETSAFIQKILSEHQIDFKANVGGYGVVGLIKGKNPEKKVVALRADMDALPILEKTDLEFKSSNEGVMHACGHDVHTACLLGAAIILQDLNTEFEGTIKLIFQPAEEKLPGGAIQMIKEGVLNDPRPHTIIGQHVMPTIPAGKVGFKPNEYMASTDEIYLRVHGKGGHAAMPDLLDDVIVTSAEILLGLQKISSRFAPPSVPTVLSFGKIIGNGATNIIPDEVKIDGTFRTMNENWRKKAHQLIRKIAQETATAHGCNCDVEIVNGYPVLHNDSEKTNKNIEFAKQLLHDENVLNLDIRMTAEDFAYFSQEIPSTFYRLGVGKVDTHNPPLHNNKFMVDEKALNIGASLMSYLAIKNLS